MKWKRGATRGLQIVADIMCKYRLPVTVRNIYAGTPEHWEAYFRDAREFRGAEEARLGEQAPYLEGDTTLRMHLLCRGFGQLVGGLLRARHPWGDGPATIEVELVADNDLRGTGDRKLFCESLVDWARQSRLICDLGVVPRASARCESEAEEPLLLLPDYVAGLYHHADPRTHLVEPVVQPEEAVRAFAQLRERHGVLWEGTEEFAEVYPLAHDGDRVTRRRR